MNKALVIVESPAKAKTINKYLGKNYIVKSSFGHVRDLPNSGLINKKNIKSNLDDISKKSKKNEDNKTLIKRMGIDPWNNWEAKYEVLPNKEKIISELKQIAEKVDHIYLATDPDREGEAIAWHLKEVIGGDDKRYSRIIFNEITKKAICQAFKNPGKLNINCVNAQQARRFIDRLVGFMISPLLWKRIARKISAGRVQSVALRLLVEREREIRKFIPKEYWTIDAITITHNEEELLLQVTHQNNKPFKPDSYNYTMSAVTLLKKASYQIINCENILINSEPRAPFITSTLQQSASIHLGFSVRKTMMIAQRLYEAGHITYMRTDSTNLSQDAIDMARLYINEKFGKKYLPVSANKFLNKKNSQESHEAIRPSDITVMPKSLIKMKTDEQKLYQLICYQFIACQMMPAQYNLTTINVSAGDFLLKANKRILHFDGWMKIMQAIHKNNDANINIPLVNSGDRLLLNKISTMQHFTNPPVRFNEASLIKELEKRGIGRPSTYVSILSTIQDRGYVRVENRRLYTEKIGEIVTDRLESNFRELIDYNFTAQMESDLEQVANHKLDWRKLLDNFFKGFIYQLDRANKDPEEGGMQPNQMMLTSIECPTCGKNMGIRIAATGIFLGCSGYFLPYKERCKTTINLIPEDKIFNVLKNNNKKINTLCTSLRCKQCGAVMNSYFINERRKLCICGNNPVCNNYKIEEDNFFIRNYDMHITKCEKCSSNMYLRIGRFGKYMSCTNDNCKNTRKILSNGELAPPRENPIPLPQLRCEKSNTYFTLRDSATGIFLAASNFPKSRETRAPLVEELYKFRAYLPEKLHYLANAPQYDPQGNKTVVRFSKKTKQQYISTDKHGKPTGWSAFFMNGEWIEKIKEC